MTLLEEHLAALRRDRYSEATLDARERVLRTCLLYTSDAADE